MREQAAHLSYFADANKLLVPLLDIFQEGIFVDEMSLDTVIKSLNETTTKAEKWYKIGVH